VHKLATLSGIGHRLLRKIPRLPVSECNHYAACICMCTNRLISSCDVTNDVGPKQQNDITNLVVKLQRNMKRVVYEKQKTRICYGKIIKS